MPLSLTPAFWVENSAQEIKGLDLLGLRQAAERFGVEALSGVATNTPAVRYFSLRCLIVDAFRRSAFRKTVSELTQFASTIEAAFVLGNLLVDMEKTGLVGSDEARERLQQHEENISLSKLVNSQIGLGIYGGSSNGLNLTANDDGMAILIEERGIPLANYVNDTLKDTRFWKLVSASATLPKELPRDVLKEFGEAFPVDDIPEFEAELLLNAIVPNNPLVYRHTNEIARIGTYAILLHLADTMHKIPSEREFFTFIESNNTECPTEFYYSQKLWTQFAMRDLIAVCHEAILGLVSEVLEPRKQQGFVDAEEIVLELLDPSELKEGLSALGIVGDKYTVETLNYLDLDNWISQQTSQNSIRNGMRRWDGDVIEERLIRMMLNHPRTALAALPIVWMVTERRVDRTCSAGKNIASELSMDGFDRFGLNDVIAPRLKTWESNNASVLEMIASLIRTTVDQHLRVVWYRSSTDMTKDGSVLFSDGIMWAFRKRFEGGRLASRIDQVTRWLKQLKLIGDQGITEFGKKTLSSAKKTLVECQNEVSNEST